MRIRPSENVHFECYQEAIVKAQVCYIDKVNWCYNVLYALSKLQSRYVWLSDHHAVGVGLIP